MRKIILSIIAVMTLIFALSSCEEPREDAAKKDQQATEQALQNFQQAQPIPRSSYSQLRQNLIEIQQSQMDTTATTTFFYLEGIGVIAQCPSIGYPIATTAQLTNPEQKKSHRGTPYTIAQMEPTGIFTGESTGTYVICVNGEGDAYAQYWEGYTLAVAGQAKIEDGNIALVGEPSADFSTGKN